MRWRPQRNSDARRRDGESLGPFDGIPILIKDNIEAIGLPGTAGSRALAGSPVLSDAPLVARLRAAGLVVIGSTNLSEWANFRSTASTSGWSGVGGQTGNPLDPGRNTSGSSSGSARGDRGGLGPAGGWHRDRRLDRVTGRVLRRGRVQARRSGRVPGEGIVPI